MQHHKVKYTFGFRPESDDERKTAVKEGSGCGTIIIIGLLLYIIHLLNGF